MMDKIKNSNNAILIMTAIAVIFFPVVFQLNLLKWDILDISLPWRYFIGESLRSGELPWWNPYFNYGFPQGADPQTWYPISAILSLPFGYSVGTLNLEYFLHLLIAGFGFRALLKRFDITDHVSLNVGAIAYACSGFMVGNAQHLGWIVSAAWIPWIFNFLILYTKEGTLKHLLFLILTLFFLLTGGYPGLFIVVGYIMVVYFIGYQINRKKVIKRQLFELPIAVLFFIGLSSVVLISSFEIKPLIYRSSLNIDQVTYGSISFKSLISLLFPFTVAANANELGSGLSVSNSFFGVILFLSALINIKAYQKKDWILMGLGLMFFLLAIGEELPFRRWLYHLPFFNTFRFPAIFRLFGIICWLIVGVRQLPLLFKTKKKLVRFLLITFASSLLIGLILKAPQRLYQLDFSQTFISIINELKPLERLGIEAFIFSLIFGGGLILLQVFKIGAHKTILLVIIFEIFSAVTLNTPSTVVLTERSMSQAKKDMAQLPNGFPNPSLSVNMVDTKDHLAGKIDGTWRNMNVFFKKPSFYGYSPYYLNTTSLLENHSRRDSLLNAPLLVFSSQINEEGLVKQYDNTQIQMVSFSPSEITVKVSVEKSGLLIYQQNNYPGWTAIVDDKPVRIHTVNYAAIGVPLDKGQHHVRVFYEASGKPWLWLSLSCLIVLIFLIVLTSKKTKTRILE